ncbi:MAG: cation:proton antiporter [Candidatus Dormibacteria bacterium]
MTPLVGTALAVLAVAAFAAPLLAERVGIPGAVLELVVGLALGWVLPSSTYASGTFIASLGALGFIILMFLVGVELDLRSIWKGSKRSIVAGVLLFVVSLATSQFLLGSVLNASPFWVLCGAATSVGITAPVLYSQGILNSSFAKEVLLVGSVAEFSYIIALNFVAASANHSLHTVAVIVGLRTSALVLLAVAVAVVIRKLRTRIPHHFQRFFRRDDPIELGLRGTFALMFFIVAGTSFIKIPDVLGALMAGIIFRTVMGNAKAIVERLTSVANSFFIPLFFLSVGLQTPLHLSLIALLPLVGLVLVVLFLPRLLLIPFLMWRGNSLRLSASGSMLLMAPLTLLITTAELGRSAGILSVQTGAAMIVTATLSALVFPVVGKKLLPEAEHMQETTSGHAVVG